MSGQNIALPSKEVRGSLSEPNKSGRGLETQIQVVLGDTFHDESGHMRGCFYSSQNERKSEMNALTKYSVWDI